MPETESPRAEGATGRERLAETHGGRLTAGYVRISRVAFPADCDDATRAAVVDGLRQLRMAELSADAARRGESIEAWYDDIGVSGRGEFLEKRTGLMRLCRAAREGRLKRVYVRDVSRLFRDLVGQEAWFAEMEGLGVEVCAADLPALADPASGRLLRQQIGALHQYMAARTAALTAAARRETVRLGRWVGTTRSRWGLRYDPVTRGYLSDPATADGIRLVFETYIACSGLAPATARRLNRMLDEDDPRATATSTGGRWAAWQVREAVRHPAYRRTVAYADLRLFSPHLIPEVVPPALVAEADRLIARTASQRRTDLGRVVASGSDGGHPPDSTYCIFNRLVVRTSQEGAHTVRP
jgi:DNA invertase Pin-like site-specific DNA recombinase